MYATRTGLGLLLVVMYPFSGGLLLPGPLNIWFLLIGLSLLFGSSFSLKNTQGNKDLSKKELFKFVLKGLIIALSISLTAFLTRVANYFQAFLYFEILYSAILIILVTRKVNSSYGQSNQRFILSASIPALLALLLVNAVTREPLESLHFLGLSTILYPSIIWMGTIVFQGLFDRLQG